MQRIYSGNQVDNGTCQKKLSLGCAFHLSPKKTDSSRLGSWQSSYSSNVSTNSRDTSYDSYEEEADSTNFLVDQAQGFCEATRAKRKQFKNAQERVQFKQQYEMKKKTELCKNFEMFGKCKYGDFCSYAHGAHQLQKKTHLPSNFMTKLCTQFHRDGICMYGERCQFLHSTYDLKNELTYTQISGDSMAECLWANLKTGDGCGAPKKPRLACFEKIYNKDSLHENIRLIEEEEETERRSQNSYSSEYVYGQVFAKSNTFAQNTNFKYEPKQPQLQRVMTFNSSSFDQPLQTLQKPFVMS